MNFIKPTKKFSRILMVLLPVSFLISCSNNVHEEVESTKSEISKVIHYTQNVDCKSYTADEIIETTIPAGTNVYTIEKTYTGFHVQGYTEYNSTLSIFYDRNTITFTFLVTKENKTPYATLTGPYGASVPELTKPGAAANSGAHLKCWTKDGKTETTVEPLFTAENQTYIGKWYNYEAGDLILGDGSVVWYENYDPENEQAVAVILQSETDTSPALGIGLKNTEAAWCTSDAMAYTTEITGLKRDNCKSGNGMWNTLKEVCTDATTNPELYPAWNFCSNYAQTAGIEGTFTSGWYLPSLDEVITLANVKDTVNASLTKANGDAIEEGNMWSCNQGQTFLSDNYLALCYYISDSSKILQTDAAGSLYVRAFHTFEK